MSDKHKIVKVEWVDSCSINGWREPKGHMPSEIKSIGFEVSRDEKRVCISTSIDEEGCVMDPLSIPMGCVKNIQEITSQPEQPDSDHWPNFELWWDQNGDMVRNSVLAMAFKEMCKECARQGWRGAQGPV